MTPVHGVGIDIADIRRVHRLVAEYGDRFTRRWFTPEEATQSQRHPRPEELFARRFAAKEAVWKAISPEPGPLPWRQIAILDGDAGGFRVELSGEVGRAAAARGVDAVSVSSSRDGHIVLAIALALTASPDGG